MWQPAATAMRAATILVVMPPVPTPDAERPAMASISGVISRTSWMKRAPGRALRVGAVEPVDVREQHQAVGRGHLRHARRQAVVVAVADLGGRHRVVLVDDRQRAERQQRLEGGARIQVAAALLAVLERQQHLRHRHVVPLEQLLVRVRQADLADGRRRLALLEAQRSVLQQSEAAAAERDRPG